MTNSEVMSVMQSALVVGVKLAAPILLLSMFLGILISIIQRILEILNIYQMKCLELYIKVKHV